MRTGCNTIHPTSRLGDETLEFRAREVCESLRLIADAGFDAAEFSHPTHLTREECTSIRQELDRLRLEAWSAHAWQPLPAAPADIEGALGALAPSMDSAERLGCKVVVVHSAGYDPAATDAALAARREANLFVLRQLCERAAAFGGAVAVENMQHRADWEFLVEMVNASGMPNAGLNVDTGHANLGDLGVGRALRLGGGRILTTHLQDNHGERDEHLPPGCGEIDWPGCLRALREVGYSGVLMVEITDRPGKPVPTPAADIRESHDNLKAFLREVNW